MDYLRESQRFYYFKRNGLSVKLDGISCDMHNDEIKFPKESKRNDEEGRFDLCFKSAEQCEGWLKIYKESGMKFTPMQKVSKDIPQVAQKQVSITDADWDKMKGFMVTPEAFEKDDFVVFESQLANSAPDRDTERFTKRFLASLMKSIVGKSKLTGHDHGTIGEGVFFDSKIEKHTVESFLESTGPIADGDFVYKLNQISEKEGGVYWGVAKYYINKEIHADKIKRIQSGEAAPMSIGFRAPKAPYKIDDPRNKEKTLYWEWDNADSFEAESLEGSDVYLGAQYGARNRKDFQPADTGDESGETADKTTVVIDENKPKEVTMEISVDSLGYQTKIEIPADQEEAVKKAFEEIEASAAEALVELAEKESSLKVANDAVAEVKEVFGDEYSKESLQAEKDKSEQYQKMREDLENFILKSMHVLDQIKFEEKESKLAELKAKSVDELFELRKTATEGLAKIEGFSVAQLSPDYDPEKDLTPVKEIIDGNTVSYQAPIY